MTSRGAPFPVITVAAVVIRDANGLLLTVRKKGAVRFMPVSYTHLTLPTIYSV